MQVLRPCARILGFSDSRILALARSELVFIMQGGTMVWGAYLCWLAMASASCAQARRNGDFGWTHEVGRTGHPPPFFVFEPFKWTIMGVIWCLLWGEIHLGCFFSGLLRRTAFFAWGMWDRALAHRVPAKNCRPDWRAPCRMKATRSQLSPP